MNIKKILRYLFVNNISWYLIRPFVYVAKRLQLSRTRFLNRKTEAGNIALCKQLFGPGKVLHGLFREMSVAEIIPTGSSLYAKLLGSYELEIMPCIEELLKKEYKFLFNIGSDEGYYAVGIARLQAGINVIAFDCNKKARERCNALAALNKVENRVVTKGCFNEADLPVVQPGEQVMFMIDCEGCENEVITPALVQRFPQADFIVELHFNQHPLVAEKLQEILAPGHDLRFINALSDHEKVMMYRFPELVSLGYEQKMFILNERDTFMQWLIATPKVLPGS